MRHGGPSGAGRRQARRSDVNDLRQAASDPGSGRTQQRTQMGHNFIPGAFTQALAWKSKALVRTYGFPSPWSRDHSKNSNIATVESRRGSIFVALPQPVGDKIFYGL
ncbi:MAG: hypothetical protein WA773_01905 [Bradyrhizobium sp.]